MRNEQSAAYAAAAYGYLTGRPGAVRRRHRPRRRARSRGSRQCPAELLADDPDRRRLGDLSRRHGRVPGRAPGADRLAVLQVRARHRERARASPTMSRWRPGTRSTAAPAPPISTCPTTSSGATASSTRSPRSSACPKPPRMVAPAENVEAALNLLEKAQRPLVLLGKGMAWSRAEDEVRAFIERTQVPFVRSPMGKGVMPDDHPLSAGGGAHAGAAAGRRHLPDGRAASTGSSTSACRRASPRTSRSSSSTSRPRRSATTSRRKWRWSATARPSWRSSTRRSPTASGSIPRTRRGAQALTKKAAENAATIKPQIDDDTGAGQLLSRALRDVAAWMPKNAILSAEGAGTMDIGLTQLPSVNARSVPQRRHLRHDGRRPRPGHRRRRRRIPTGRSSTSRATRRSASPAWRWRRWSATTCRSRSSC